MLNNNEIDSLETTKELNELNNQIFEVNTSEKEENQNFFSNESNGNTFFTNPSKEKILNKFKKWWNKKSQKQKITLVIVLFILILLIGVGIYVLIHSANKKEEYIPPVEVIVQEENYRYENGTLVFLNSSKEEIGRYTCENANEELCFVAYYTPEELLDEEKTVDENGNLILKRSSIIEETFVFLQDISKKEEKTIKLYNIKNNSVVDQYTMVKRVDENKVILKNQLNQFGLLELKNNEIVTKLDFIYENLYFKESNNDKFYISVQNGRNFIIDESGKNLGKAITGMIKNINDKYVSVQLEDGKYEVHNYNNQNIFNDKYDYVKLFEDYAVLIEDTKLYLKFYDNNKLNEEAILLKNKNYTKTSIYNESHQLKEVKESFRIEENNDILTITIVDDLAEDTNVLINKAEGTFNKTLRNLNYFDGKLYFYSDTNKQNLLGNYTCANKNSITLTTKSLTNCSLAEDTVFEDNDYEISGNVGTIPVFNERFVFINDNPDLVNDSNKTIVLYDLKKNTGLGKYREVNTYSYTGTEDITFSTVTDLQVVAKSQSGNFGVIKINLTEVKGHINFNYSEMERLKEYYVSKGPHGYILVDRNSGAEDSSAIAYKIRNYNKEYVKVKKDNGDYFIYRIQDVQGKSINETGFKYIELYDNYFAGVNYNNQLGIYTYDSDKNIISGEHLIQLNLNNYYGNGILAFKIIDDEIFVGTGDAYIPDPRKIQLPIKEN